MNPITRLLILCGVILIIAGLAFQFLPKLPWLGRLPGDIYIKKDNFSFYFPLTTSIIASLVLSLLLYFFSRR